MTPTREPLQRHEAPDVGGRQGLAADACEHREDVVCPLLKNPSKLSQPALARPLPYISQGNLGNLLRLLNECATQAIESGTEAIDQKIIENNK